MNNFNNNPVFVSFYTKNECNFLIENVSILRACFRTAKLKFDFDIIAAIILYNHCHLIINPRLQSDIPKIIRFIKAEFSYLIPQKYVRHIKLSPSEIKRGSKGIWQKGYLFNIIKSSAELNDYIDFIHFDSFKHYNILPKYWKYSSFLKFVKLGFYSINWNN